MQARKTMNTEKRKTIFSLLPIIAALGGALVIFVLSNKIAQLQSPTMHLHAPAETPEVPGRLKAVKRIVFAGDSVTQGDSTSLNYVNQVRQYLDALFPDRFEVINAGKNCETSTGLKNRFAPDIIAKKPDLIFVLIGVNDLALLVEQRADQDEVIKRYGANLSAMIDQAKSAKSEIVLLTGFLATEIPESEGNALMSIFSAELESVAKEKGVEVVHTEKAALDILATYRKTGARDLFLTIDGVHPNAQGYQVIANEVLTALNISPEMRRSMQ